MKQIESYLLAFVVMVIVMFLPNGVMRKSIDSPWYECIKAPITPPKFVLPIVWTILYIAIGVGLAQSLLLRNSYEKTVLLGLYAFNLVLNVVWSFVFFGNRDIVLALFVLCMLVISTAFILYYTYLLLPLWVFWMLLPYIAWLKFAGLLNFLSIFRKCAK
jgi:tryptophan-rich sensory protein